MRLSPHREGVTTLRLARSLPPMGSLPCARRAGRGQLGKDLGSGRAVYATSFGEGEPHGLGGLAFGLLLAFMLRLGAISVSSITGERDSPPCRVSVRTRDRVWQEPSP